MRGGRLHRCWRWQEDDSRHELPLPPGSVTTKHKDGTIIEPIQVGEPPLTSVTTAVKHDASMPRIALEGRADGDDGGCTPYAADAGFDSYTRPADSVQIVATNVNGGPGGAEVTISVARTGTQSTTFSPVSTLRCCQLDFHYF